MRDHRQLTRLGLPARSLLARPHSGAAEVAALFALYGAYELVRGFGDVSLAVARRHAADIVALERWLGIYGERGFQELASRVPGLPAALGVAYVALHVVVTTGVLVWVHRHRREHFPLVRTSLVASTAIALVVYVLYPTAPPRLAGLGFADTVTQAAGLNLSSDLLGGLYNPFAAVPSLHFGYALLVGVAVTLYARHPVTRIAGASYPLVMLLIIVATGNHFLFDAVAGGVVTVAGWLAARSLAGTQSNERRSISWSRPLAAA